jgi:hypothetical protein
MSKEFWKKASEILKVFEPIVKVLKLVDGDFKPTMRFLYEAMDRAKQAIEKNCQYHAFYNSIIDKRWIFMHSNFVVSNNVNHFFLGYFLNPQFQYGVNHGRDVAREALDGTTKVISRLEPNIYIQIRANNQVSHLFMLYIFIIQY